MAVEFGTPETWNMKVGDFIETELPKEKPQALLDLQEQNRKQRLLNTLQTIGPGLMDESLDFIRRDQLAFGSRDKPKRGLVDEPGSYGGEKFNLKNLGGGEKNKYVKTYDTKGGEKRYLADYSREGFNRKSAQPFTEAGLREARKKVKEFEKEYRDKFGFGIRKGGEAVSPSVTKAKQHPPGKPWKYRMPVKQDDGTTKLVSKYYKSEAEAKAAMEKIRKKKFKAQEVSYKEELPEIKKLLKQGKTQQEVADKVKIPFGAIQRALGKEGKKVSDFQPKSYTEDPKLRKKFIKNYRKLSRDELAQKLFPDDPPKTADSKYGSLRQALTDEELITPKTSGELAESQVVERPLNKQRLKQDSKRE